MEISPSRHARRGVGPPGPDGLLPASGRSLLRSATYDLFDVVDDTSGFARFANAVAINDAGAIVGTGRDADDNVISFMLTPISADGIFADGFD